MYTTFEEVLGLRAMKSGFELELLAVIIDRRPSRCLQRGKQYQNSFTFHTDHIIHQGGLSAHAFGAIKLERFPKMPVVIAGNFLCLVAFCRSHQAALRPFGFNTDLDSWRQRSKTMLGTQ